MNPNILQISKGAASDLDLFSKPWVTVNYAGPSTTLMPPMRGSGIPESSRTPRCSTPTGTLRPARTSTASCKLYEHTAGLFMLQWHSVELRPLPAYQAGDGVFRQEHWSSARGCRPKGRPRVSEGRNAAGRSARSGFPDKIESGSMRPHGHTKPTDTRRRLNPPAGAHSLWVSFFMPETIDAPLSPLPCSVSAAVRVWRRQHRGWNSPELLPANRRTRAAGSAAAEFSSMCPPSLHPEAGGHSLPYGIVLTLNSDRDSPRSSSGSRPVAMGSRPA